MSTLNSTIKKASIKDAFVPENIVLRSLMNSMKLTPDLPFPDHLIQLDLINTSSKCVLIFIIKA